MQAELKDLLIESAVPIDIVDWMEGQGLLTMEKFVNSCDIPDQVGSRLVVASGKYADNPSDAAARRRFSVATANIKQAWPEAKSFVEAVAEYLDEAVEALKHGEQQ